jgi:mono/diheme cytochrome c family protein
MRLVLGALAASVSFACAADADMLEAGKRIYRDGVLASGAPLRATGQNGIAMSGAGAACAHCHRRSGYGASEGQNVIRPLPPQFRESNPESAALRARPLGSGRARPFYTPESLGEALRHGVAAGGQPLKALMPRYELPDPDVAALAQYLHALAAAPAPGVSATTLRFATVVTPEANRASVDAMLAVLRAFFTDKNGVSRSEIRRRASGSEWTYQGYRTWNLDVWELRGPPETWAAQLEERYRAQPVFALLSGLGSRSWQPVHEFCERFEVPCVLPHTAARSAAKEFYSIYYTPGAAFGGELLARHFAQVPRERVIQVFREGGRGSEAAQAMRAALPRAGLVDIVLGPTEPIGDGLQDALRAQDAGSAVVLWLEKEDLERVRAQVPALARAAEIYVSAALFDADDPGLDPPLAAKVRVVYPYDLPEARAQRLARARSWMKARNIAVTDERVQANTFFAASLASDALGHLANTFSREYFVERIEHMASRLPNTSFYPRISLAPGQRYASKGGYIVRLSEDPARALVAESGWIVP